MALQSLLTRQKSKLRPCKTTITTTRGDRFEIENGAERILPKARHPFVVDDRPDLEISKIVPGLFLSSQDPVAVLELLEARKIKNILSLGVPAPVRFEKINYFHFELLDLPDSNLRETLPEILRIILEKIPENILVHCNAGVSRSVAVVIAYLIVCKQLSYEEAFEIVKRVRPCARPNDGFVRQLKILETEQKGDLEAKCPEAKDLEVKDLEAKDLEVKDLEAKIPEAKDLEAKDLEVKDLEAKDLEVKDLETKDLEARSPEAKDLEAKDLEVKDLEAKSP